MTNYAVQEQNQDLVSLLATHFRLLYNPTHALVDALSIPLGFPGLAGFWPGGSSGSSGQWVTLDDRLGLANMGTSQTDVRGLVSFRTFNGSTQYYTRPDEALFDITGTEGFINSSLNGLTLGAWIYPNTTGSVGGIAAKWDTSANRSYQIIKSATENIIGRVSVDGSASTTFTHSGTVTTNNWNFAAMRFVPSISLGVWINGDYEETAVSIPASIFNSTASFDVGAVNGVSLFSGRIAYAFLCAAAVQDRHINTYFQMTAPLFGVSV